MKSVRKKWKQVWPVLYACVQPYHLGMRNGSHGQLQKKTLRKQQKQQQTGGVLRVLLRGGVETNDLITIYIALIRSLLEYCCVVWHHALPSYLSQELERIQKRAFKIIVPALSYSEALHSLNLRTLDERRSELCVKTLEKISRGGPLVKHLPMTRQRMHNCQTRWAKKYTLTKCRAERLRRSFFPKYYFGLQRPLDF